jgi:hypothetical protein
MAHADVVAPDVEDHRVILRGRHDTRL